jgi:hypothetical protein
MRQMSSTLLLLLGDERSAVPRNTAVLFSLVVLATTLTGLLLLSFGDETYRHFDRRVLRAAQDLTSGPLV